jgi:hypothetical protein
MDDDDPEKRIRELERELADTTRAPSSPPPYTGDATYTENPLPYTGGATYTENPLPYTGGPTYTSNAPYLGGPQYGFGTPPPRRSKPYPWFLVLILLAVVVPTVISLVMYFVRSTPSRSTFGTFGGSPRTTTNTNGPTAVPQGGELRVGGDMSNRTVACNDGKLTLYGTGTTYSVTGHCASLTVGGYNNNVTVDSADTLESTGYSNTVAVHACNNGKLKLSSYGMAFDVTGHCASIAISSYDNHVTVESVDTVNVSGYNNVVIYHSGTPKITDSGYSNNIQQG